MALIVTVPITALIVGSRAELLRNGPNSEEDKRATTNVQNGLVFLFFSVRAKRGRTKRGRSRDPRIPGLEPQKAEKNGKAGIPDLDH